MRLGKSLVTGALVAGVVACGCVPFEGPISYHNDSGSSPDGGGSTSTGTTSIGSGGSSTTSTSASGGDGTGGIGGAIPCSTPLSDEFTETSPHACWQRPEPSLFAEAPSIVNGSELLIRPAAQEMNGWFQGHHGPFMFQNVTGDFTFVAGAYAATASQAAAGMLYNTAGLLARDPLSGPGQENWVMIDIGRQGSIPEDNDVSFGTMIKVTNNSVTAKNATTSDGRFHAALAICRRGNDLTMLYRLYGTPDGVFTVGQVVNGWPSMSSTLQVGLVAGTWVSTPDLHARFAYARFGGPGTPSDCMAAFQAIVGQGA